MAPIMNDTFGELRWHLQEGMIACLELNGEVLFFMDKWQLAKFCVLSNMLLREMFTIDESPEIDAQKVVREAEEYLRGVR